jgi:hypothetical protein
MRTLAIGVIAFAIGTQQPLPPPFPRPGVVKMLENARVVVWNISWPKGQPTALHRHAYDLVGSYYTSGDRVITEVDGTKRNVTNKAGEITFRQKGLTHIEEGISDSPLRAVFIELKQDVPSDRLAGPPGPVAHFHDLDGTKRLMDNSRVTVWSYDRASAASDKRHVHDRDAVTVWLIDGTPHAAFISAGTVHTEEQVGVIASATVYELK